MECPRRIQFFPLSFVSRTPLNFQNFKGVEPLALLLKALVDPARLRILNLLAQKGEMCNCHFPEYSNLFRDDLKQADTVLLESPSCF